MLHYYLSQSQDIDEAKKKQDSIQTNIFPFEMYLKNSIESLEQRKVKATWTKLHDDKHIQLESQGTIYKCKHQTTIAIKQDFIDLLQNIYYAKNLPKERDFEEKLIIQYKDSKKDKIEIKEEHIIADNLLYIKNLDLQKVEKISWAGDEIELEKILDSNTNNFELYAKDTSIESKTLPFSTQALQFIESSNAKILKILEILKIQHKKDECHFIIQTDIPLQDYYLVKYNIVLPCEIQAIDLPKHKVLPQIKDDRNIQEKIIYVDSKVDSKMKNTESLESLSLESYIENFIGFEHFYDSLSIQDSKEKLKLDKEKSDKLSLYIENKDLHDLEQQTISSSLLPITFNLAKKQNNCFIKLQEIDEDNEESIESPLRYFFDEDVRVEVEKLEYKGKILKKVQCQIIPKDRDEFIVELRYKGEAILPCVDSLLSTKPNTYQLKMQKLAIQSLIQTPMHEQHVFIDLFRDKKDIMRFESKQDSKQESTIQYEVLTEETRNGCKEQREFIHKALHTKDFAILEGPPGSGKTTTILELIVQIIKKGQRILLCGSTHVAIDNVLERLKEKGFIDKYHIFPFRVGSDGAISEQIKEYKLGNITKDGDIDTNNNYKDSLFEKYQVYSDSLTSKQENQDDSDTESSRDSRNGISLDFFIDLSNLVCGTTIGILQYPKFKRQNNDKTKKLVIPEFDYLIIDECSKTTFQEFLVPAMYAKKWILVGDTRQLSPFVESKELEANIENLPLNYNKQKKEYETLPKDLQKACFVLCKVTEIYKKYHKKLQIAVGIDSKILKYIDDERHKRKEKNMLDRDIQYGIYIEKFLEMLGNDILFFDKVLDSNKIPESFFVIYPLEKEMCKITAQSFAFHAFIRKHIRDFKEAEMQSQFREKTWASEIAWRLIREFELRTFKTNRKKQGYARIIDELLPKSIDSSLIRKKIATCANIALPSILEALIKGIKDRYNDEKSTIKQGFDKNYLKEIHTILTYQHRMHPEISRFPRTQFYKEDNALLDSDDMHKQREWNYGEYYREYKKRNVWIDIKGKTEKGRNIKEAKALIEELKKFIDFAKRESKNKQGENWSVAVLSFYKGQVRVLEEKLQDFKTTNFSKKWDNTEISIKLCSVDRFQGQEADIVFLSMVNTHKIGFLDNPNRLNVGITRAKYQLVIFGDYEYFATCNNEMLNSFAKAQHRIKYRE